MEEDGYFTLYRPIATLSPTESLLCIKMGSNESRFSVSLIVRDKVTRECPQITAFEEKGRPKRFEPRSGPLLSNLMPYR